MSEDKLPPRALSKIFALKDREQQALTIMSSTQRAISETQRAHDVNPHGDKATALAREVARLQALQPDNQARHRVVADLNAQVEHFLTLLPADAMLDDAKPVKVKLKPGETRQQLVVDLRLRIVKLIDERSEVERAALPVNEIKAQAKKWIVERAMKGRPAITATHERFDVKYSYMEPSAFSAVLDPLTLLAWFDPEHLKTKLNELIDEMPKPALALTPLAKAERLASIKSELFEVERLECGHIEAALTEGTVIAYRPNTDPQALLGIEVSRSEANAA